MSTADEIRAESARIQRRNWWIAITLPVIAGVVILAIAWTTLMSTGAGHAEELSAQEQRTEALKEQAVAAEEQTRITWETVLSDAADLDAARISRDEKLLEVLFTEGVYGSTDKAETALVDAGVAGSYIDDIISTLAATDAPDPEHYRMVLTPVLQDASTQSWTWLVSLRFEPIPAADGGSSDTEASDTALLLQVHVDAQGRWSDPTLIRATIPPGA